MGTLKAGMVGLASGFLALLGVVGAGWAAAPVALVEDVASTTAKVQMLDYLSDGQVVELGQGGTLTLGYLSSCVQERIIGGRVTVGAAQSQVESGTVERTTTKCNGNQLTLTAKQAMHSGAVAFRDTSDQVQLVVNHRSPIITVQQAGQVVLKRVDVADEQHILFVDENHLALDLLDEHITLTPGATYLITMYGVKRKLRFKVAEDAEAGDVALVSRLVPF